MPATDEEAFARWRFFAAHDDPEAQSALSTMCANGWGVEKSDQEAGRWLQRAAENGHSLSQYSLACQYAGDLGFAKNLDLALHWLDKAAEGGLAVAQYELARRYAEGDAVERDEEAARHWFTRAAAAGSADAAFVLAKYYAEIDGDWIKASAANRFKAAGLLSQAVKKEHPDARVYAEKLGVSDGRIADWRREAAEAGCAEAQFALAQSLRGPPALEWYAKAAETGHAEAQHEMAVKYMYGSGVDTDDERAVAFYRAAAERGHAASQRELGSLYEIGARGLDKDLGEAVRCYEQAAEGGDDEAQLALARLGVAGKGVGVDHAATRVWLSKAARRGSDEAQSRLGQMFAQGLGVAQDFGNAAYWYWKVADTTGGRGDWSSRRGSARLELARMFAEGRGVARDEVKAFALFEELSLAGWPEAKFYLGECYEHGRGVAPSQEQAVACYAGAGVGILYRARLGRLSSRSEREPDWMASPSAADCYRAQKAQACESLSRAAAFGDAEAKQCLSELGAAADTFAGDEDQVGAWFEKTHMAALARRAAREAGSAQSETPRPRDAESQGRTRRDAEQGDPQAQFQLFKALGWQEGSAWLRVAAEQGHAAAQLQLAIEYDLGENIARAMQDAAGWYSRAAEQGEPEALRRLGELHEIGVGIGKNLAKAVEYHQAAAAMRHRLGGRLGALERRRALRAVRDVMRRQVGSGAA